MEESETNTEVCPVPVIRSITYADPERHRMSYFVIEDNFRGSQREFNSFRDCIYVLGGILFVAGTVCYFPTYKRLVSGAAFYITGSTVFLVGDIVGALVLSGRGFANVNTSDASSRNTEAESNRSYQLPENVSDIFCAALYVTGSAFLFPSLQTFDIGVILFIIASITGSYVRFVAIVATLRQNRRLLWATVSSFAGYFAFFFGSFFFLSYFDKSVGITWVGAVVFFFGSICFTMASMLPLLSSLE